jgi:hypothetical protein
MISVVRERFSEILSVIEEEGKNAYVEIRFREKMIGI